MHKQKQENKKYDKTLNIDKSNIKVRENWDIDSHLFYRVYESFIYMTGDAGREPQ